MDALAEAHQGWVNFEPAVHPDDVAPAGGGFFGVFSGRGPDVPLATWTAPTASRRGRGDPAMIGLQHGAGDGSRPTWRRWDTRCPTAGWWCRTT